MGANYITNEDVVYLSVWLAETSGRISASANPLDWYASVKLLYIVSTIAYRKPVFRYSSKMNVFQNVPAICNVCRL